MVTFCALWCYFNCNIIQKFTLLLYNNSVSISVSMYLAAMPSWVHYLSITI